MVRASSIALPLRLAALFSSQNVSSGSDILMLGPRHLCRFHTRCIGITVKKAKSLDSFVCTQCTKSPPELYCHCRKPDTGEPMVACDRCDKWSVSFADGSSKFKLTFSCLPAALQQLTPPPFHIFLLRRFHVACVDVDGAHVPEHWLCEKCLPKKQAHQAHQADAPRQPAQPIQPAQPTMHSLTGRVPIKTETMPAWPTGVMAPTGSVGPGATSSQACNTFSAASEMGSVAGSAAALSGWHLLDQDHLRRLQMQHYQQLQQQQQLQLMHQMHQLHFLQAQQRQQFQQHQLPVQRISRNDPLASAATSSASGDSNPPSPRRDAQSPDPRDRHAGRDMDDQRGDSDDGSEADSGRHRDGWHVELNAAALNVLVHGSM